MSNSIELSPKHGVNLTIPVCFWCGEEKNEIALLGHVRERDPETGRAVKGSDLEAPMRMVLDYEPCECCKEKFNQGVPLIECTYTPEDNRPLISKDYKGNPVYPTGSYLVMKPEAAQRIFNIDKSFLEEGKNLCLHKDIFKHIKEAYNI